MANRFIAPMAFELGMTIPQFKKLSDADRQAVIAAYSKLMAPAESDRGMIREVRPRMPAKGEHVPIERQVWLGEQLLEVKAKLPHGHFRQWVEDKTGITWTQASRFVKLAKAKAAEDAQREQEQIRTHGAGNARCTSAVKHGASSVIAARARLRQGRI